MGLFNRRRSPSVDTGSPVSPSHESDLADAPLHDVIRASTLHPVPEWTKVPPLAPLLPDMPLVVAPYFQDSLVAWQPPERFLGDLGHAVTPEAPSGIVTGLATHPLAAPELAARDVRPSADEQPLPLAVAHPAAEEARGVQVSTRRLDLPEWPSEDPAWQPSESSVPAEPTPEPAASPGSHAEPAVVSELVGAAPPPSVIEPLVRPLEAQPMASRLVHAPTPPELPLVELPSARLPEPAPAVRTSTQTPVEQPEGVATIPLVGERGLVDPTPTSAPPVMLPPEPAAASGPPTTELPLASPSPSDETVAGPRPAPQPAVNPEPPELAPLVGLGPPLAREVADVSDEPTPSPAAADVPASPLPLARDAAPGSTEESPPDAPLLGQAEPIAVEPVSLTAAPNVPATTSGGGSEHAVAEPPAAAPRLARAGLGAPMAELPSTSRSWDITSMSHAEQVRMSRALIQSQMGASARARAPIGQPLARLGTAPGQVARPVPDTVFAGMPLPRVSIEPFEPPLSGVTPPDLPPAGEEVAPLLSEDSLFGPDDREPSQPANSTEGARARVAVGQRHNVDLANVPIDRSSAGASEAVRRQARAFTTNQGVVIPPTVGSLDSGSGEALLAHELTHVAQRVRYGSSLPDESTPVGQALEAEARSAELVLDGGAAARAMSPRAAEAPTWSAALTGQRTGADSGTSLPLVAAPPAGPDVDALAASIMDRLTQPGPASGPATETFGPASWSMGAPTMAAAAPSMGVQRAATDTAEPAVAGPPAAPQGPDESHSGLMERPSEEDLSNLSRWLYPLIKYRLKGELREDRERAGLITDHYRRW